MTKEKSGLPSRIRRLAVAAGSQNKLADLIGVSGPTITGWMGGSAPYQRTLMQIAEKTGVSLEWLRDGRGSEAEELAAFARHRGGGNGGSGSFPLESSRVAEEPVHHGAGGWRIVVRVLSDRLTSTQIAEAMHEILSHKDIDESVRNYASQILIAAQLPKLKR